MGVRELVWLAVIQPHGKPVPRQIMRRLAPRETRADDRYKPFSHAPLYSFRPLRALQTARAIGVFCFSTLNLRVLNLL